MPDDKRVVSLADRYDAAMSPDANDGRPRLELRPFRGLRYVESAVSSLWNVTSPPVDLLDAGAIRALKHGDPHNIVRLILPRGTRGYLRPRGGTAEYAGVEEHIRQWRVAGVLSRDERPALYVYEYTDGERSVQGLIGEIGVHEPADRVVHPHEAVRPEIVADCVDLMVSAQANLEPILAVYDGDGPAGEILAQVSLAAPRVLATSPEGWEHRLWLIDDPRRLRSIAADLAAREALIADGHHRYAAYRSLRRERGDQSAPANRWNYGLALLVDQLRYPLRLGPIHRSVPHLKLPDLVSTPLVLRPMATRDAAERALADDLTTQPGRRTGLLVSDGTQWVLAELSPDRATDTAPPVAAAILHNTVLPGLVADESTIGYHHSVDTALRAATDTGGLAFIATPPSAEQVMDAARQGITLPRKTTSFGPKPRIGFVLRMIE
jgi:uncharacterized protein (DUF1015 family)